MSSHAAEGHKLPTDFFERLREIYLSRELGDSWQVEEPTLKLILTEVASKIDFNYKIIRPFRIGGSGVIAIVEDKNLKRQRALKVSRPVPGKEKILARALSSETKALQRLSHSNLIQVFAQGVVTLEERDDYPFYVMEFIDGVLDSDEYLAKANPSERQVLQIFSGTVSAVQYFHEQGTVHMDLKPSNILVTPRGIPILSDLGFAKQLRVGEEYTLIGGTEGFMHPDHRALVQEIQSDPNRLTGFALREKLKTRWDLFSLGKTFLRLLEALESGNPKILSAYTKRYLKLLACRLLDGHNSPIELALGLSVQTFAEIRYDTATDVAIDLEKLTGTYNLSGKVPELNLHVQDTIQSSTVATTPFTKRVGELLSNPIVMRLGTVSQLGLLNLIYPTATHSRLEHSIGTFSVLCRYIQALYNDPLNPLFRQIMSEEDLRASLLSALLHDVGHFPLAHDLEEADPTSFKHEDVSYEILAENNSLVELLERDENEGGWGVPIQRVISILRARPQILEGTMKDRILHSLIDGPIDADKVDYLMRDSIRLGLNYGRGMDLERLLRTLTIVFREQVGRGTYAALGTHEKGKIPAEAVAFARYAMFGNVYWHHAYRSIKSVIHRIVWEAQESYDKDEKSRSDFRENLREFIRQDMKASESNQQPALFALEQANDVVCQIQYGDLAMLEWIANRAKPIGKTLLALLASRRLFKRVLVLSSERADDKILWKRLSRFYATHKLNSKMKVKLQKAFQEEIKSIVQNKPLPVDSPPSVITESSRVGFLQSANSEVILLIDLPSDRQGSETQLEFIIEEDRRRVKIDVMQTGRREESIVWKVLQDNFQQAIGKLRVFCHPDHEEFLSAFLDRTTIESALERALTEVEKA